jgi:hypothetical protein
MNRSSFSNFGQKALEAESALATLYNILLADGNDFLSSS